MKTWKIQKFFGDVVYDLRSRGLLPLAILLVVAMVAVPVYIKRSGSEEPAAPATALTVKTAAELAPENQAAVLAYNPGLRDYKKRLKGFSKDPFTQQFTAPAAAAGDADSDAGGASASTGGGGTSTTTTSQGIRYFFFETDVAVGEAGGNLQRRNRIDFFSFLPSDKVPVLVFNGAISINGALAASFLVSEDVTAVEGGGTCLPDPDSCQLLALKPGATADLTYAVDNKIYRIKVLRVELVITKKPPKG